MREQEGGVPKRRGRRGRVIGLLALLTLLALLASGPALVAGLPAAWAHALRWPPDVDASRGQAARAALSSPQASPSALAGESSPDTLAAAQAIVAPASPPARLLIPAIGVNAPVEALGLDAQGRMATPSRPEHVGWYSPGTAPGDVGNAVIDGHLDWTDGPAVFWRLGRLKRGDQITIARMDGSQARFDVQSSSTTPYDASTDSLFTRSGPPSLTLITCAGAWDRQRGTYLQRLVVRASLVAPPPTKAPGDSGG